MQTVLSSIHWGNVTLVLDQLAFEEGYTHGRQYYFLEDECLEQERDGIQATLSASYLLGLIALRDKHGFYQLDDSCDKSAFHNGVEELLGILVGYLSGPLHPETSEERILRESEYVVIQH